MGGGGAGEKGRGDAGRRVGGARSPLRQARGKVVNQVVSSGLQGPLVVG